MTENQGSIGYPLGDIPTGYEVAPFPKLQQHMIDWLGLMRRRHMVHALVEVDVTRARQDIREYRAATGEPLSLTAFITTCYARAIDENKSMHAYRKGRNQLVLFDDVDVTIMVEHEMDGHKIPMAHIVRAANKKGIREIQQEIRAAQEDKAPYSNAVRLLPLWLIAPGFVRRFILARLLSNPHRRKKITGTVSVTAVGMFGSGTGWGIPMSDHTLCLTIGGTSKKPGVVNKHVEVREYLCLTISVDHDVIDGAPATRFAQRLKELIESGTTAPRVGLRKERCRVRYS